MLKRWMSGEELKKRLSITDADLMDYIITGDLQAYSENLEPFTKDEFREMTRGPFAYLSPEWPMAGFDGLRFKIIEASEFAEKHGYPRLDRQGNIHISNEDQNEVQGKADEITPSKLKPQKIRPTQRHKEACRNVAVKLWEGDSTITITDMILSDEIALVCENKTYAEKTIRNWIKDLCPNRLPGRRPTK